MSEADHDESETAPDRNDLAFAAGLGLVYVAILLAGTRQLGYARDEGFYAVAARAVEGWFDVLDSVGWDAFRQGFIDRHFGPVHEHPGLMKTLFALSHRFLYERHHLFAESGTAYRFPAMAMGGLAVAVIYLWGRQAMGRLAGFFSAAAFAFLPHVFFHAHLACLDVAAAAMWLVTGYAYYRGLVERSRGFVIAAGVLYGLFLDTKHNAWLFPFAIVLHLALVRVLRHRRGLPREGPLVPPALLSVLLLGPVVFYLVWPWIWFDTFQRLAEWVRFHLEHDYYNMEFLGQTYYKPPMPRLYAWLMTLGTVPAVTLCLFAIGLYDGGRAALARSKTDRTSLDAFWLVGLLVSYAPWLSSDTPIFGGTKHWITAYPFLCLFAGRGLSLVRRRVAACHPFSVRHEPAVAGALLGSCLIGPVLMSLHAHPYGLSFYTPLVGGVPGAASLGQNRGFWGYTTGVLTDALNERAPPNAAVYLHDTALASWELLREDGRVRSDLRATLSISASSLALYHHEQHMQRVEYQVWVDYGTVSPVEMRLFDGVPIVWLYARPSRPAGTAERRP